MATNGCFPVHFFSATETGFYFEEAGTDVEEDNFLMSCQPIYQRLIRSNDNKFLVLNAEHFQGQNLTTEQQRQPEYKFNIQIYKDSTQGGPNGRAVMLYANKDGKKMVVCCNDEHEIHPVQMDLPHHIGERTHKAVFYMKELSTSKHIFESSWYPSEFLGFESDGDDHTLRKLVLRYKAQDEVDDSLEVNIS